ncbi:terpene synthase family protein [Aspergillus clavatus NRRL 1]|uniref:Terpenoid synthase n=1 Tax=Aspergillus clavatus (strain ATCC 1007 / CBS 513.65 / DSM 816 / NCTC 3887 / NRRL 1 / QM 1276 / 107) TaxID=344612 RepID=A1C6C1_ASPCL|nr:uncharacterized protein ACLA_069730 [Aspergillus clavatus NRRL 1]EAW13942.1 hypothetical protein ACLA_069730 [Aspergillus clavatus NRRL 1]
MTIIQQNQSHSDFRDSLRGQSVVLPNLYSLFPEWKPRLHPEYARARDESLNPWIERWVPDPVTSRKFQAAEFGVFAAIMCADASYEKLCTMSKSFAWYREKSLQYFRHVLCGEGEFPDLSGFSLELQYALLCWDEVAAHIREVCSKETCEVLLEKKLYYVSSVDTVDTICEGDQIPSLVEYWDRRERTAGVYPVIATIPFIYGQDVSHAELATENMRLLWRHTSYLVHM